MNGFSTKRFFDSNHLKKGMLITVTYKDGVTKSGLLSSVTPESVQFTYMDEETANFLNEDLSIEKVESGLATVTFARHLTDLKQERPEGRAQSGSSERRPKETPFSALTLDELLQKGYKQGVMEQFFKHQRDAKVIAFILSRLSLSQNECARLLLSLPDALSLSVQKQLNNLSDLNEPTLEEKVKKLIRDFLNKKAEKPKQAPPNPFSGAGGPFADLFGGQGNPLADLLGGNKGGDINETIQDVTSKLEDMMRKFMDDKDDHNRPF